MAGFIAREGYYEGIHDDLWMKSVVLQEDDSKLILLSLDIIGLEGITINKIKDSLTHHFGVDSDSVMISTTHTHAGPATLENANLGYVSQEYINYIVKKATECVNLALLDLEEVELRYGKGICREVGKNRREVTGMTDPEVLVLSVYKANHNELKTVVVNYACHPTVLGPDNVQLSADFPYYLYQAIERIYEDPNVLFINGAAGNINVGHHAHDSINGKSFNKRTFTEAKRHGYTLAGEVVKVIEQSESIHDFSILYKQMKMSITFTVNDMVQSINNELKSLKHIDKNKLKLGQQKMIQLKEKWSSIWLNNTNEDHQIHYSLSVGRIGPILFVTLPGEFFVELGLLVKQAFPQHPVLIFGYTNGSLGYVADQSSYIHGGYEIEEAYQAYGFPLPIPIGTGEAIIKNAVSVLKTIIRD
ncbi:hypothetical protein GS400_13860 [Pontibacillus sp. HMF3514]|nr:hypothetical protein GS400_13860 [Pontibacillus sp. HMF3514]